MNTKLEKAQILNLNIQAEYHNHMMKIENSKLFIQAFATAAAVIAATVTATVLILNLTGNL